MATDLGPSVNGVYGGQYGQPVELAASVPSSTTQGSQAAAPAAESSTSTTAVDPQQIGWYFVQQFYTTLSKHPDQIHLFYNKKSQLVIGTEAEKVVPSVGKNAIKDKIKELDIQDCKIRVLNVDSQTSLENIVVQVIGVMSNKSAPSKKFVQTFVLTPQINGFYVLNDIFRYLNDEEDEIIEDEPVPEPVPAEESIEVAPPSAPEIQHESVDSEASVQQIDAKLEEAANAPPAPSTNDDQSEPAAEEPEVIDTTSDIPEDPVASVTTEDPPEPEHTPALSPPKAATPPPAPEVPPSKKTWAHMVGAKASAPPVAASVPAALPQQPKKATTPTAAQQSNTAVEQAPTTAPQGSEWQTAEHSKKPNRPQNRVSSEGNVLAYIKNVTEKIDGVTLKDELEKYGELKYFDVSRPRNCAFVEFATSAGYSAAVNANPHQVGTEQIYVEERRPRPNAFGGSNSAFNRGGANPNRGRGGGGGLGSQPRTSSQGGFQPKDGVPGRGSYQQRGGRSGNVTPRGRGQPQAV